eukprot:5264025-Pyramimonas_sp.AAC.1
MPTSSGESEYGDEDGTAYKCDDIWKAEYRDPGRRRPRGHPWKPRSEQRLSAASCKTGKSKYDSGKDKGGTTARGSWPRRAG